MLSSSIINKKKQKKVREDDDNDSNNDDLNEDFVPLVTAARAASPSLRATNKSHLHYDNKEANKKPFRKQVEMTVFRQKHKEHVVHVDDNDDEDDENYYRSSSSWSSWWSMCWGNTWRLFGSCMLAMLLIVPLAIRRYQQSWPSDDLVCAKPTYQMNFSQLYHQVAHFDDNGSSFCTYPGTTISTTKSDKNTQQEPKKQQQDCICRNPTLPNSIHPDDPEHLFAPIWNATFARNVGLIQEHQEATAVTKEPLDVVLLGDSITERWLGTGLLGPIPESSKYIQVYHELFTKTKQKGETTKPSVQGLALGIAGDRCPQLLYRLQNGELNFTLPLPKVFWILIGINDLQGGCAKETVLVGLMRIIQELQQHLQQQHRRRQVQKQSSLSSTSTSWIVVNSILPAGQLDDKVDQDTWQSIQWVNHRLECYTKGLDHVEFYNATDLFLIPNPSHKTNEENNNNNNDAAAASSMIIDESLMHDLLHPSPRGQRLWGEAIVKKVLELTKATTSP